MPEKLLKAALEDADESSLVDGFEFLANDTNNSMPMADKPYDPPVVDEEVTAYSMNLAPMAQNSRSLFRPQRRNYTCLYIRARRKYFEPLLWQMISTGVFTKEKIYAPEFLRIWTVGFRMRVRNNYPLGRVIDAIKCRLGINHPGLRFCLDGFYGMINYTDIFGNMTDSCPWMEISNFSTVSSLKLMDGDSIFVSIASIGQIENVTAYRMKCSLEVKLLPKTPVDEEESREETEAT